MYLKQSKLIDHLMLAVSSALKW